MKKLEKYGIITHVFGGLMEILNMSQRKFDKLKSLELGSDVCHSESMLYFYDGKYYWKKQKMLIKKFLVNEGESFGNKLYNINTLLHNKNIIGLDNIVMPSALFSVDKNIEGYIMPYIESKNFNTVMHENFTNIDKKIFYLKQIGRLLEDMKIIRQYYLKDNFFLGDIHENNFIVDKNNKVNVVDIDSCYIKNGNPFPSKMLYESNEINAFPNKYKQGKFFIVPNENTDLYCYIMLIINSFTGLQMQMEDLETYYTYLEYLSDLGFDRELLDIFALVYENADNMNPYEYLDTIPNNAYKAHINLYKKHK